LRLDSTMSILKANAYLPTCRCSEPLFSRPSTPGRVRQGHQHPAHQLERVNRFVRLVPCIASLTHTSLRCVSTLSMTPKVSNPPASGGTAMLDEQLQSIPIWA